MQYQLDPAVLKPVDVRCLITQFTQHAQLHQVSPCFRPGTSDIVNHPEVARYTKGSQHCKSPLQYVLTRTVLARRQGTRHF